VEADRQWFAHTSDGKRQLLAYHDIGEEAEVYVESNDGGKTWGPPKLVNDPSQATLPSFAVAPTQGDPVSIADQGVNTFSGPMLVDKNDKDFYVVYSVSNADSNASPNGGGIPPFGAVRGLVVAHSADAGQTWSNKYAVVAKPNPSDPSKEDSVGTMFPWGFLDPAGNVYIVFGSTRDAGGGTDHYGFYYVFSGDKGKTWSKPKRIDGLPDGKGSIVFNTGAAVRPGVIDVAWLQKDSSAIGKEEGVWNPWFAQITSADTAHPHITRQQVTTLPNHKDGVCILGTICLLPQPVNPGTDDRSLLDFIELSVNPKTGLAGMVYADNGGFRPGQGDRGEVVFAQQTVQPKIVGPNSQPVGNHPTPSGAGGAGDNGAAGSPLPNTGSSPLLPISGAVLLSAAAGVALWRRRA
jgi:LPXTG-motif cell wall-anchored protein